MRIDEEFKPEGVLERNPGSETQQGRHCRLVSTPVIPVMRVVGQKHKQEVGLQ